MIEQAVKEGAQNLDEAISQFRAFLVDAKAQSGDAETNINAIDWLVDNLEELQKEMQGTFDEITAEADKAEQDRKARAEFERRAHETARKRGLGLP